MKLFANGCSFTWGGAVYPSLYDNTGNLLDWNNPSGLNQQRIQTVWPGQLAKLMNIDHVNLSIGSGSNERIVRTTLSYFTDLMSQRQFNHDWVAIIQWTQSPRFEFYDDLDNTWTMCLPSGCMTEQKSKYQTIQRINRLKDLYYYYTDYKTYSEKYFQQIVTLSCFFEMHSIKYYFSNLDKEVIGHLDINQQQYLKQNISWIGDNPYICFGSLFKDRHESESGHPSVQGHQEIANSIYNHIRDKF